MKLINVIACATLSAIPLLANASDLKISNGTKSDLSFSINNICSDKFDGFGVIPAETIKMISEKGFNEECNYNPQQCIANVYNRAACKGDKIAEIGFDTSQGVTYISGPTSSENISIIGNGFNLLFTTSLKK